MAPHEKQKIILSIVVGSIVFALLALFFGTQGHRILVMVAIFGTLFLALWWSKIEREVSTMKTVITNKGTAPMKYIAHLENVQIPESFDINFIESQVLKIQNDPSLLSSYFTALKTEFHTANQISVINCLERYNRAVASGVDSGTEVLQKKKDFLYAKKDLLTIEDDLEIQRLEKELTKTDLQLKIEMKQQEREDIKKSSRDNEDYDL